MGGGGGEEPFRLFIMYIYWTPMGRHFLEIWVLNKACCALQCIKFKLTSTLAPIKDQRYIIWWGPGTFSVVVLIVKYVYWTSTGRVWGISPSHGGDFLEISVGYIINSKLKVLGKMSV